MKTIIFSLLFFFLNSGNSHSKGNLYYACVKNNHKFKNSRSCKIRKLMPRSEKQFLEDLSDLSCPEKYQKAVFYVAGKKCNSKIHLGFAKKLRRVHQSKEYLNSRRYGNLDPLRKH